MSNTWRRFLSLLLSVCMILSLGITGYADDGSEGSISAVDPEEQAAPSAEEEAGEETVLESYELDPDKLQIPRLGQEDAEEHPAGKGSIELVEAGEPEDLNRVVRVSIFLDDPATLDAGFSTRGVAKNAAAVSYRNGLRARQGEMTAAIEGVIGHPLNVHWNLTLAANAISAELTLGEIAKVEAMPGVRSVQLENRYLAMEDEAAEPNTAHTSENMVGAAAAWAAGYTGAGSRIAIIDTGLDTSHQSFNEDAFFHALDETGKTLDLMTSIPEGLNGSGVRVSAKIPYAYNYVDKNINVTHMSDTQGEHGSHVAGIAAANRFIRSGGSYYDAASTVGAVGMAPDAQLLIMKVFGASGGAYDSDYMVAIEDAIAMDADVVNLSLGSSAQGFTFDNNYQDILNDLANGEHNSKMIVSVSAGNAGDLPAQMNRSDLNLLYKEDVSTHTGGSPGTFVNSLCVAAAENTYTAGYTMSFNDGRQVFYAESTENAEGEAYGNPALRTVAGTFEYVYIDAKGEAEDYAAVNSAVGLPGKVVIVDRGELAFSAKGNNAIAYDPKAVVIANDRDGVIHMELSDFEGNFPMVTITLADAEAIKAGAESHTADGYTYYTGSVTINAQMDNVTIPLSEASISDFSSWGVPGSLLMKPEITAPGGGIYSVYGTNMTENGTAGGTSQYEYMSGTSMAAPHIAGLVGVLAQYLRENPIGNTELTGSYNTRAIAQSLMMSTAKPLRSGGSYQSVLQQGAGLADVNKAVLAKSVIMMSGSDENLTARTGAAADGKVKAELGDDPARCGEYSFSFTLYNLTDTDQVYSMSTDLFTQAVTKDRYLSKGTAGLAAGVGYTWDGTAVPLEHDVNRDGRTNSEDAQAILDYLTGLYDDLEDQLDLESADMDEDGMISSKDAYLLLDWAKEEVLPGYVLPANGTAKVTVTITLTDEQKAALDEKYRDEWSDGGAFIEGFTYVKTGTSTGEGEDLRTVHSIPILGFYGAWTDPTMFDTTSYVQNLYEIGRGEDPQEAYANAGSANTNYLRIAANGIPAFVAGNPYKVEEKFPADRLAINSSTQILDIGYNLVRAAGTTGFAVSRVDEDGQVTDLIASSVYANAVSGLYYSSSSGGWQNTAVKAYSVNKTPGDYGLKQGDRFRIGFYAIPEYNAMLANDSYNASGSGALSLNGFKTLLLGNALGKGAYVGCDFIVDDTDPQIGTAALNGSTLTVSVTDNQALAYVAVLSLDGETVYSEAVPGSDSYSLSLDATDAIAKAQGYVAVFAGDYAGNEVARALKVNDNIYEEKTVFILSSTLTAGGEYLIVDRGTAGAGSSLSYTLNSSGAAVPGVSAVTVCPGDSGTGDKPYIETTDLVPAAVWTADGNAGSCTFQNGGFYLGRSNTNSLSVSVSPSDKIWAWDGADSRLSCGTRYLRFESGSFSLNSAVNSVYLYQKTVVRTELEPYGIMSVSITPSSLDLYKGNTADLTAKLLPLTAEDRTVTWSSADTDVAVVDEFGHVTAVAPGRTTITATANGDSTKSAACTVKVTSINKSLNGIIWDESGSVFFSDFNVNSLPAWNKLSGAVDQYLHNAFMANASTLYASTVDTDAGKSVIYSVDRSSYELTQFGTNCLMAFGMAKASTRYTNYQVYGFAKYLIFGNLSPRYNATYGGTYSGIPYGLIDLSETDVGSAYVCGVCAKSVGTTTSHFYFLDETGKIWQLALRLSESGGSLSAAKFDEPTLVVDTGISTSFIYQSLYYDGTYLYWSHQTENETEMIIIVPSTGKIYHAGSFGEGVWPAAGLYVDGAVAPASADDEIMSDGDLIECVATYEELMTEDVIARFTEECACLGLPFGARDLTADSDADEESPEDPDAPVITPVEEPVEDPAEEPVEDPVIEPAEENEGSEPAFGTLTAFRGLTRSVAPSVLPEAAGGIFNEEAAATATVSIRENEDSRNGLIALAYDPETMTFVSMSKSNKCQVSVGVDEEKGVITIAYARWVDGTSNDCLPAGTSIVDISFSIGCEDSSGDVTTLERNDELELNEIEDIRVHGIGHDWGEPVWTWAEDHSAASAAFVCRNDPSHTVDMEAEVICEAGDPTTTYTATVVLEGKTYTDVVTVTRKPDYVLFGRINGRNYACEENDQESSEYVFKDGKLSVLFEEDSYVAVKFADDSDRFMTDGYPGDDATSATLYSTSIVGERADKLRIPGNTLVELSLTENEDGTLTLCYEPLTEAAIMYGASISLKGNIGLNFYLILPESVLADEGAYATLTVNEGKENEKTVRIPVAEAKTRLVEEDTMYRFSVDLHAKQMNDKVTIRLFGGDGTALTFYRNAENITECGYSYTIQDYVKATLERDEDEKLVELVKAMSDFGSLAQVQFAYDVDGRAALYSTLDVKAEDLAACKEQITAGAASGMSFLGSSLLLYSETTLRFYFEKEEGKAIEDFTFAVNGEEVSPVQKGSYWYVDVSGVNAKNLDKPHTVVVSTAEGTVLTIEASGLSYAYKALAYRSTKAALKDLAKGLYLYNQAAAAYFAGQDGQAG